MLLQPKYTATAPASQWQTQPFPTVVDGEIEPYERNKPEA